ncbi:hypothetical protein [Metapseudomonas otitidis]|uniref:hypothetical protein n=1 Tax=Metapseudomonas otitidis TaxID=319939 RepID=UPI0013F5D613|nr:hypothetical protein [Pseudomonas otitidis]
MSIGLLVPVRGIPKFSELLEGVFSFLSKFFEGAGKMTVGVNLAGGLDLSQGLIIVQDHEQDLFCWVSFSEIPDELREDSEHDLPVVAQILTRSERSILFSVAVSYAVGMMLGGRFVYDDGHIYFDSKKDFYSLLEVGEYIATRI